MSCCVNLIRYFLFLLNSACFLVFSALTAGATYLLVNLDKFFSAPVESEAGGGRSYQLAVIVILVVFVFLSLLTCLGCSGPAAKSSCLMKSFTALLILLICATVGLLVLLNIESGRKTVEESAQLVVREGLEDSLAAYQEDETDWTIWLWEKIQANYQCCGLPAYIEQPPSQNQTDCRYDESQREQDLAKCSHKIINSPLVSWSGQTWAKILSTSLPLALMVVSLVASLLLSRAFSSHWRSRLDSESAGEDFHQVRPRQHSPAFNPQYQPDTELSTFPNAPPSYDEVVLSRN